MNEETEVKRGPGRPKKTADPVARESKRPRFQDVALDIDSIDPTALNLVDRMHIDPEEIPEDEVFVWASLSTNGRPEDQNLNAKGRAGWRPVRVGDLDGRFDNRWDRKQPGEAITFEGNCMLMHRPKVLHEKAKRREYQEAREQLLVKERQFTGGNMPNVSLDATHPTAIGSNKITKSFERIEIPDK